MLIRVMRGSTGQKPKSGYEREAGRGGRGSVGAQDGSQGEIELVSGRLACKTNDASVFAKASRALT